MTKQKRAEVSTFEELRAFLSIDSDALDECLMEQSKLYESVAEATAAAEGARDLAELELDELTARTEKEVRDVAATAQSKITESAVKAEVVLDRHVQSKHRAFLELQQEAKTWRALERSFDQRADMLKKLVDLHLRTTYGYSLESGVGQARGALVSATAEVAKTAVQAVRRKRLEEKA